MSHARAALFIIDGFEETEALCTVDILRRAEIDVATVSLGDGEKITGRSKITILADALFGEIKDKEFDMLIIPGGTIAYAEHEGLLKLVKKHHDEGRKLAAICAAPAVFGKLGLLAGKRALIYPGMESMLEGALPSGETVETDGNITTSKGPGTTVCFALRLVEILAGKETAETVAERFIAQRLDR
ncbi:MAG: DJ-1/PfpI family protein [Synergistaceae bacterium]|jgi:4-methyl-5(b-hydroxyethyl)-thiazole monophosphate biosynthesis|nr:DJ-1/PfpI family protein [Synergistaceae bacterium]